MAIPNQKPTVSVVMPVYNGELFIAESIRSVMQQSFRDWELIVVDDASADASVDLLQAVCAEDERIRPIQLQQNSGAAVARNTAIESARGRYIAFLDDDDLWVPHKLERQLAFMQETGAAFSYSAYERIDEAGQHLTPIGVPERVSYRDLCKTNYIGCSTAIYDTQVYGVRLMPLIRKRQDYGLWLDLLRDGQEACGLNKVLATYRVRTVSISSNKASVSAYNWHVYRELEQMSPIKAGYYFCQYAIRGVLRRHFPNFAIQLGFLHRARES